METETRIPCANGVFYAKDTGLYFFAGGNVTKVEPWKEVVLPRFSESLLRRLMRWLQ